MARLTLPLLGGSPSVWALTMSFFQTALRPGDGYAHAARTLLTPRQGIISHCILLALVFLLLNFEVNAASPLTSWASGENLRLLAILTTTVGLPFAVMSANAPMLQNWFSMSRHKDAESCTSSMPLAISAASRPCCSTPFSSNPSLA